MRDQQGTQGLTDQIHCLSQDLLAGLDRVNTRCSELEEKLQLNPRALAVPATAPPSSRQTASSLTGLALVLPNTSRTSSDGILGSRRGNSSDAGSSARGRSAPQNGRPPLLGDSLSPLGGLAGSLRGRRPSG